jgi:hypothetical protein
VRGQREVARATQGVGAQEARVAAAAGDVGLDHVHGVVLEQPLEVEQVPAVLARRDLTIRAAHSHRDGLDQQLPV